MKIDNGYFYNIEPVLDIYHFAELFLVTLIDNNYDVVGVVSQPDKEVGRKKELTMSPVKECALKHNIPVYQPRKIRKEYEEIMAPTYKRKKKC